MKSEMKYANNRFMQVDLAKEETGVICSGNYKHHKDKLPYAVTSEWEPPGIIAKRMKIHHGVTRVVLDEAVMFKLVEKKLIGGKYHYRKLVV